MIGNVGVLSIRGDNKLGIMPFYGEQLQEIEAIEVAGHIDIGEEQIDPVCCLDHRQLEPSMIPPTSSRNIFSYGLAP